MARSSPIASEIVRVPASTFDSECCHAVVGQRKRTVDSAGEYDAVYNVPKPCS
jgi:hypothetical protein